MQIGQRTGAPHHGTILSYAQMLGMIEKPIAAYPGGQDYLSPIKGKYAMNGGASEVKKKQSGYAEAPLTEVSTPRDPGEFLIQAMEAYVTAFLAVLVAFAMIRIDR